jgi:hypothetical protein
MSRHYSQALVEAYSEENSLDGTLFARLRSSDMPVSYCWRDRTTEALDLFQFGMTCDPSTEDPGVGLLTWYLEGSRAKTLVWQERCGAEMVSMESDPVYGGRCSELLARFARPLYSVKTLPHSERTDWMKSSEPLPASGMIAGGSLWELSQSDSITNAIDSGSMLPTPTARDWKDTPGMTPERKDGKTRLDRLPMLLFDLVRSAGISTKRNAGSMGAQIVKLMDLAEITITGPDYCPELPEWVMGWPIGWTALKPLETGRFRQWLLSHGKS